MVKAFGLYEVTVGLSGVPVMEEREIKCFIFQSFNVTIVRNYKPCASPIKSA